MRATWLRWTLLALIVLGLIALGRWLPLGDWLDQFKRFVADLGPLAPVAFGVVYVVATLLFVPGSVLTLAGGAVFGVLWGTAIVLVSATLSVACAFLITRYLARDRIARRIEASSRFAAIDRAIAEGGWKIVALLRLSPAVPFGLQNYVYGLTSLRFWPCVLTSFGAMLPGTLMYSYLGYVGERGLTADADETEVWQWVLRIAGLIATIAVTWYVTRLARRELRARTDIEDERTSANAGSEDGEQPSETRRDPTGRR